MNRSMLLGRYYPGDSLIHRLDPRLKFCLVVVLMVTILIPNRPFPLLLVALGSLVLIFLSKLPTKELVASLRPIMFIVIFAFAINLFSGKGDLIFSFSFIKIRDQALKNAILMAGRLIFLVIDTSLLISLTTTSLELSDAIESLLSPLQRLGFPAHEIAMMMSIALRFVPTLVDETDKIIKAQSSRGANYDVGGFLNKARGYTTIIVPLFVSCFRRAYDLALAMEARCYRGGEGRTKLKELHFKPLDLIFACLFCLACGLILWVNYQFPNLL